MLELPLIKITLSESPISGVDTCSSPEDYVSVLSRAIRAFHFLFSGVEVHVTVSFLVLLALLTVTVSFLLLIALLHHQRAFLARLFESVPPVFVENFQEIFRRGTIFSKKVDGAADDLTCPITHQLPNEPVTAEDGRVYERSAIEDYFRTKTGYRVPSPLTRKSIGKKLLPAPQTKNTIEILVKNGVIQGDLAMEWKEQEEEENSTGLCIIL